MKKSIFVFMGVLLFSMISRAGLPAKNILRFEISSTISDRTNFPVYIHTNTDSPKALVFFIAASGCTFSDAQNNPTDIIGLDGSVHEWLLNENYAVVVPGITEKMIFPRNINHPALRDQQRELCNITNQNYLADLRTSIKETAKKYPDKNIYVWGYFYGAYLVNILASEQTKLPQVQGYISTKGWWDSNVNFSLSGFAPATQDPIHNNPAFLSRILVIHSQEDFRIGLDQMTLLKKWATKGAEQNLTVRVYPEGLRIMGYPLGAIPEELINDLEKFLQ